MADLTAADCAAYIKALTGYTTTADDQALIEYIMAAEVQHVLNDINQDMLPGALNMDVRDVVAGKFIMARKAAIIGDDSLNVVKSISEGGVSVSLGGTTAEQRLDALTRLLTKERDYSCFRKFRW